MSITTDPLASHSFPELAEALRAEVDAICQRFTAVVRETLPSANPLTFEQVRDDLPVILDRIADALESPRSRETGELFAATPEHGKVRFDQNFDLRELLVEYRLLRPIVIERVQARLGRATEADESQALHVGFDIMMEQATMNFVAYQRGQLVRAAEAERRFLSFLSHDLRNNLNSLVLTMEVLKKSLHGKPAYAEEVAMLESSQEGITTTVAGMERLLQSERLRGHAQELKREPVDVASLVVDIRREYDRVAERKGINLATEVRDGLTLDTDRELLALVLQNLLSNAVKYSTRGTVRVRADRERSGKGPYVISVADEGQGIAAENLVRIFESFQRGETYGQGGVGLGLSIASQAAKLLGGELTVESKVGAGSTFRLTLPAEA